MKSKNVKRKEARQQRFASATAKRKDSQQTSEVNPVNTRLHGTDSYQRSHAYDHINSQFMTNSEHPFLYEPQQFGRYSNNIFEPGAASQSLFSPMHQSQASSYPFQNHCSLCNNYPYGLASEMTVLDNVNRKLDRLLFESTNSSSSDSPSLFQTPKLNTTFSPTNRTEEQVNLKSSEYQPLAPLGVFWDIENCAVPKGKSALAVVQRIRERFFSGYMEAEFVCVCDIRKESPQVIQELNDAQVSVVHVSGNSKNAADDKLRQAMRRYADVYTSTGYHSMPNKNQYHHLHPPSILLISGDVNFSTDLSDLRYRKRLYVILLHNTHAPDALLVCAHEHYNFHTVLEDLPDHRPVGLRKIFDETKVLDIPLKGGHCPMDVVVTDLPYIKNIAKLKNRLRKLSDNCGGKVTTIQGQFAVIRFPNKEAALRASKRMNGEDVFGSKIKVLYSSQMEFNNTITPSQAQTGIKEPDDQEPNEFEHLINNELSLPIEPVTESKVSPVCSKATTTWKSTATWDITNRSSCELGIWQQHQQSNIQTLNESHSSTSNLTPSSSPKSSRDSSPTPARVVWPSYSSPGNSINMDNLMLKREVASLLRDVPSHTLPLFRFREMFERRYRRSVSAADLYKMRDVVSIFDGSASSSNTFSPGSNGRTIVLAPEWQVDEEESVAVYCQIHPPLVKKSSSSHLGWAEKEVGSLLPNVLVELKSFSENLHKLLELHEGGFPLLSFLDCYESEFSPLRKLGDGEGVALEHIISCVPRVEIANGENGIKRAQLVTDRELSATMQPSGAQLVQLSRELIDLLKTFSRCAIPFAKLIPAYHHHFGRQLRVADFGHLTLFALLKTLPSTIQILGDTQNRVVTLCHRAQMKRFATDVLRILKAQIGPKKQVALEEFPEAYSQLFGKDFVAEDYGLCFLNDLVSELVENSTLVTLTNSEGGESLAIPKREQTSVEQHKMRNFSLEVVELLRHSVRCEIPFSKFIPCYHHHFNRQCRVSAFGFSKLIELLDALPEIVEIVTPAGEERIIRLTQEEQRKFVGEEIWNLVHNRELAGIETLITDLEDLFSSEHGYSLRPELCGTTDLRDLCSKLSQFLKVEGDRIELVEKSQVEQLVEDMSSVVLEEKHTDDKSYYRGHSYSYPRSNSFKKNRSPLKIYPNYNNISAIQNSVGCSNQYSQWENSSPPQQTLQPMLSISSPNFSSRTDDSNVFTFDMPPQPPLSPQFYDVLMRDSPPVSPPMVWAYHPIVYPPPASPGASGMMLPTFTFNGPWNNSSSPTLLSSSCYENQN